MVESIANIVRAWPADRAPQRPAVPRARADLRRRGRQRRPLEMEWSINIRCEPRSASALDGAISAAYPDVRLGRVHGEQPLPAPGRAARARAT